MVRIEYVDRVRHVFSEHRTNDEELAYALTIDEPAESIDIKTLNDATTVEVVTPQTVYHFSTFRADYVGHASRTLVQLLEHFHVHLPIEYLTAHQTFTVYVKGERIVSEDEKEYPIAKRADQYELVEPVTMMMSREVLDTVLQFAEEFSVMPVEIVESAMGAFYSILSFANEHAMAPEEVLSVVTNLISNERPEETPDATVPV
ncbi:hypothetical protein [Alicyclobacillus sp. ALC3]|uniref:hypothetical protein n=1 Tax=Alicyclobacillus sp. ALC3 TaxID=2796143 RepID=UPI0023782462|nr:hypothetical protein [Alicyclobacillus sp. ALC3]WDL99692.1 hypothetical protein JC200_23930 [Alicyclobacillus sp. ALC3]